MPNTDIKMRPYSCLCNFDHVEIPRRSYCGIPCTLQGAEPASCGDLEGDHVKSTSGRRGQQPAQKCSVNMLGWVSWNVFHENRIHESRVYDNGMHQNRGSWYACLIVAVVATSALTLVEVLHIMA